MNQTIYDVTKNGFYWQIIIFSLLIIFFSYLFYKWINAGHFDNNTPLGGNDNDTAMFGIIGIIYRYKHKRLLNDKIPRSLGWLILIFGTIASIMLCSHEIITYRKNIENVRISNYSIIEGKLVDTKYVDNDLIFQIDGQQFSTPIFLSQVGSILKNNKNFRIGGRYQIIYKDGEILKVILINI